MFRNDRRKGAGFASILDVGNPPLFRVMARPLTRHLLLHHGAATMRLEAAVIDRRPRLAIVVNSLRRTMLLSPTLEPGQIDYTFSELGCLSW